MKCHLLPVTYWRWQSFENRKGEAEGGEWEGGYERSTASAEYLFHWDIEGEKAGGKMSKIPFLVLKNKWKCHACVPLPLPVLFSFSSFPLFSWNSFAKKFILEEKMRVNNLIFFYLVVFTSLMCWHCNMAAVTFVCCCRWNVCIFSYFGTFLCCISSRVTEPFGFGTRRFSKTKTNPKL